MEAAPRLPMISFTLKVPTDAVAFAPALKKYISAFYHEDPESYSQEIYNLEGLRESAARPTSDVAGVQLLKKYFCQLNFLKTRFPMEEGQPAAVYFSWKDTQANMGCSVQDVRFELMCVLHNIGAMHTILGAAESRNSPEGLKMACTHFQCAAWAFQTVKEKYYQSASLISTIQLIHFMQQVCLAQAQECLLEKSMLDNRKSLIIAKVAVQVFDYYRRSLQSFEACSDDSAFHDLISGKKYKEWVKYLQFKLAYHKCVSLLFQGQQAEEQQKMGERVAFYQAACEELEEARKLAPQLKTMDMGEALAFTSDVVEGKRKAAKNENEFIYHEQVPNIDALQEVKGASLVKGIPFNVNDIEVSGPDIFARLVPMEAHEASSLYSEKKAQLLRQLGELIECKDQDLAEFMSSMQLEFITKMRQACGIPQEIIDRAAALSAKPNAAQDLLDIMEKLSTICSGVECMLSEIDGLLKEEEESEKQYQQAIGKRPPSIIATDLAREAAKYREAHSKANDSNQALQKALLIHVSNIKILSTPLRQIQQHLPNIQLPNRNVDEKRVKELEVLVGKVEEMRNQRAMLWGQLREAVHNDDITGVLVTKQEGSSLEQVFDKELQKHQQLASLIEQNAAAQENIKKALIDVYANSLSTRRYIQDIVQKRSSLISALISSYDTYEDLMAKANKGIEFYNKLETNISKLLQRIRSACNVQQEERDQMLGKKTESWNKPELQTVNPSGQSTAPKLKDYLEQRKKGSTNFNVPNESLPPTAQYPNPSYGDAQTSWPPAVRPAPLGSEFNDPIGNTGTLPKGANQEVYGYQYSGYAAQYQNYQIPSEKFDELSSRFSNLQTEKIEPQTLQPNYSYSSYIPQNYTSNAASYSSNTQPGYSIPQATGYDPTKVFTSTINSYQTISSPTTSLNNTYPYAYPTSNSQTNYSVSNSNNPYNYPESSYSVPNTSGQVSTTNSGQVQYQSNMDNTNVYYPPGYAPNYSSQKNSGTEYGAASGYHSNEYATSVAPNISNYNFNSTYSSPLANTASSKTPDVNYMATGIVDPNVSSAYYGNLQSGYGYAAAAQNPQDTSTYANYASYENYYGQTYPQSTPTVVQNPQQPQTPTATQIVPQQPQPQISSQYPQPVPTPSQYPQPTPSSSQYPQQAPSSSQYPQQTPSASQYPSTPTSSQFPQQSQVTPTTTTSQSNIDLLSGLDFNISQAALIPQQQTVQPTSKPVPEPTKPETPKAIQEEASLKLTRQKSSRKVVISKSLNNSEVKQFFSQEEDKFEKVVDMLTNKTLSGPTSLELKWKEIQDKQEGEKKMVSVARCYPRKNRFSDILPFDSCRVELLGAGDDYINASLVEDLSPYVPSFILTQLPLPSTISDFWTMVYEQQIELIFCVLSDNEIGPDTYWPQEKGKTMQVDSKVLSLQSVVVKNHWTERLISVALPEKRETWTVLHLQFTSWPGSLFPTTPEPFLSFVTELITLHQQQRCLSHPLVIHCLSGVGRSGLVCLLATAILEMTNKATMSDPAALAANLSKSVKNIVRDREHLKFAYECLLAYIKSVNAQEKKKKKLNQLQADDTKPIKLEEVVPEKPIDEDPLNSLDPFWASKK